MAEAEKSKNKKKSPKPKRKRAKGVEIERRKRRILEILIQRHQVTTQELAESNTSNDYAHEIDELKKLFENHEETKKIFKSLNTCQATDIKNKTINDFIKKYYKETLCTLDIPIEFNRDSLSLHTMEMAERWKGTGVGNRLTHEDKMIKTTNLANKVVDYLKENSNINKVLLSSGTTIYKVAKEILRYKINEIGLRWIYTTSILVLDAFLLRNPPDRHLHILGSEFASISGALKSEDRDELDKLSQLHIDASILSFTCLSETGFWVDEKWEKEQMLTLLRPNEGCKLVIIPLEWSKIGHESIHRVEGNGISPTDVLDGLVTSNKQREYLLITNVPEGGIESDAEKKAVIDIWDKRGLKLWPPQKSSS